jgi:hypothetical protein
MLRIIGVFLYLPLLLIVLSPCNLYYSSTIVMSTSNVYILHTTTLYYILHAESYNTIPGGRVTTAGWCIDMTIWYTWCKWFDWMDVWMVWCLGGTSGYQRADWLCLWAVSYGFERVYMGDGYGAKHNALWCSRIEAYTHIIYYIEWQHAPITYMQDSIAYTHLPHCIIVLWLTTIELL